MRLFLLGDGETLDAIAELSGRLAYESIARSDDPPARLDAADQVVIECRDPARGRALLAAALDAGEPGYIGLLTDEKQALVTLLKLAADRVPKARLDRIAAPAGLSIGARSVEEQAIAVVAQLIASRRSPAAPGRATA